MKVVLPEDALWFLWLRTATPPWSVHIPVGRRSQAVLCKPVDYVVHISQLPPHPSFSLCSTPLGLLGLGQMVRCATRTHGPPPVCVWVEVPLQAEL